MTRAAKISPDDEAVRRTLREIVATWREGRPRDVLPLLHPDVAMSFPGFEGGSRGAEALVAGFEEFCETARVHDFRSTELALDVVGDTAVTVTRFEMLYEREGGRWRSTGIDLWVLQRAGGRWLAVWRTMLDLQEAAVAA